MSRRQGGKPPAKPESKSEAVEDQGVEAASADIDPPDPADPPVRPRGPHSAQAQARTPSDAVASAEVSEVDISAYPDAKAALVARIVESERKLAAARDEVRTLSRENERLERVAVLYGQAKAQLEMRVKQAKSRFLPVKGHAFGKFQAYAAPLFEMGSGGSGTGPILYIMCSGKFDEGEDGEMSFEVDGTETPVPIERVQIQRTEDGFYRLYGSGGF